eukprot:gene23283-26354_t
MHSNKRTVVFISGFLTPTDWLSYPVDLIPENINLISVYPSPTGSLHDRACQVFYELFGGTVDYGKEHSDFHNHERFGRTFEKGKLAIWDEDNPITIIGHSLGGCTAWVLQNYLAQGRFAGIPTSAAWVSNVICVSAPLNGALQVHTRGKDMCHPPLVRWGSSGCMVGWCAQWVEYFDLSIFKSYMDFQQDNVAYDVTIKSQLEWAKVLQTFPMCRYVSVVGQLLPLEVPPHEQSLLTLMLRAIAKLLRAELAPRICGVDTSTWAARGGDGLLDVYTQEYPRLYEHSQGSTLQDNNAKGSAYPQHRSNFLPKSDVLKNPELVLEPGVWHYTHHHMSHLNTAFGCNDTWGLLMQIVTHLGQQKRTINQLACTPDTATIAKPDMQKVKFSFAHREETSFGVGYRQRNLYFALSLLLLLWFFGYDVLDRVNRLFFALCAGLLCIAVMFVLPRHADAGAPRRIYLSNKKLLITDVAETVYALYRLVDTFSVTPVINETTLLCEVVLQSLLPRPLLDHANPPTSVLVSVLLLFVPDIWRAVACTSVTTALMLLT